MEKLFSCPRLPSRFYGSCVSTVGKYRSVRENSVFSVSSIFSRAWLFVIDQHAQTIDHQLSMMPSGRHSLSSADCLTQPAHVTDEPDVAGWADAAIVTAGHNQPNNADFWPSLIPPLQRISALFVAVGLYMHFRGGTAPGRLVRSSGYPELDVRDGHRRYLVSYTTIDLSADHHLSKLPSQSASQSGSMVGKD